VLVPLGPGLTARDGVPSSRFLGFVVRVGGVALPNGRRRLTPNLLCRPLGGKLARLVSGFGLGRAGKRSIAYARAAKTFPEFSPPPALGHPPSRVS
jgi:hypothetical protein